MKERKDQNEKIKELTEKLHAGIQELHDSEKYRDYLRTMAKFKPSLGALSILVQRAL